MNSSLEDADLTSLIKHLLSTMSRYYHELTLQDKTYVNLVTYVDQNLNRVITPGYFKLFYAYWCKWDKWSYGYSKELPQPLTDEDIAVCRVAEIVDSYIGFYSSRVYGAESLLERYRKMNYGLV